MDTAFSILINGFYRSMDLSALHASQTLCHICLPFKIHNLLLPRKEDYLLVGPLFTENLSESDFQLLLAEYGVKPTEDLLIYFHSLTSMEEESFQRLLHYLSEELGKPFTEITLSRPPHAICPNPICPPVSIKNAARPSPTTCSPAAWNKPKSCSGIVLCRLEK